MTPPETRIRRAYSSDIDALNRLALASKRHWGYDDAFITATRRDIVVTAAQIRDHDCYLAEREGRRVGFYLLRNGALERMFVAPDMIGRGIGRSLMEHMTDRAEAAGLGTVEIVSDPNAAAFYRRMGAVDAGVYRSSDMPGRTLPRLELMLRGRRAG